MLRDLPPIARKLYGLLENDRFEEGEDGEEWQAYWMGAPLFASVGSTCARERDNVAAVARACEAIAGHPGTGYRFSRERVAVDGDLVQQLVVWRPAGQRRAAACPGCCAAPPAEHRGPIPACATSVLPCACMRARTRARAHACRGGHSRVAANLQA